MKSYARSPVRASTLALVNLLVVLACLNAFPLQRVSEGSAPASTSVTATVRSVDAKNRRLEVVTGVGFACWVVRVRTAEHCQIKIKSAPAKLVDLKPGDIVRIQYRKIEAGNVAETVEALEVETAGSRR